MNLICKPRPIFGRLRPAQRMKDILAAGFNMSMLDISALSYPREFESLRRNNFRREPDVVYLTEHPEELVSEADKWIARYADKLGLAIPIALAPYAAPDIKLGKEPEVAARELNDMYRKLSREALKAAVAAGCKRIIVHPLFAGVMPADELPVNRPFYLELAQLAEELNSDIQILLINTAKDINGHFVRGICAEPEEAIRWVDELNDAYPNRFGFCFDIGTATLCGQDLFSAMAPLGDRLKAVIIRDTDGTHDISLIPYTACIKGQQTQWLEMIRALRKADFDGDLILDFADSYGQMPDPLRRTVLSFAYEVGEFLMWHIGMERMVKKYNKRVLFGAGNMCREYISNYGKDYPPLFTCDNNSARWGEDFFGITIENPEKLKELSPDTAIFICNMYYDEITEQLRGMGLPNPIEKFSDEYMPTFHMVRLDLARDPKAEAPLKKE